MRLYLLPALGAEQLQRVTPDQLSRFYRDLLASGGKDARALSPNTVRRVHATAHRALRDAARWGYLQRNPATAAVKPRQPAVGAKEIATWSADEMRLFLKSLADDRLFAMWRLAATTGMRRGEDRWPAMGGRQHRRSETRGPADRDWNRSQSRLRRTEDQARQTKCCARSRHRAGSRRVAALTGARAGCLGSGLERHRLGVHQRGRSTRPIETLSPSGLGVTFIEPASAQFGCTTSDTHTPALLYKRGFQPRS